MFSRSSFGQRSSASSLPSSSPPSAVILNDDGSSSEDDSTVSNSYGVSNDPSKQGKKAHRRSVVDQLRLCFLTGRLSRFLLQVIMMLAVGVTSSGISFKLFHLMLQESPISGSGFQPKPPMMAMYFKDVSSRSFTGHVVPIIPPRTRQEWLQLMDKQHKEKHGRHDHHDTPTVEPISTRLDSIDEDSSYYDDEKPEITPNPESCTPQHEWQTASFPACNNIHEHTMASDRLFLRPERSHGHIGRIYETDKLQQNDKPKKKLRKRRQLLERIVASPELVQQFKYLAHGYWRDTWRLQTDHETVAFKTMRLKHDLTEYLMDKQRRDAVTSDRLRFSKQTIQMYGACGSTAFYEFAPGGDLEGLIERFDTAKDFTEYFSPAERLLLAYNVSSALADVHTTEGPHTPVAIVHGDFKSDQFVAVEEYDLDEMDKAPQHKLPHFKLGDFNLARFVYWNEKHDHPCVIKPDGNGGKNRAPEEYENAKGRTEKLDIYSLGNLIYTVLTGHFPFDDLKSKSGSEDVDTTKVAKELVMDGRRPHVNLDADIRHSEDPMEQAMLTAVEMCWEPDPHDRPSATEVEQLLAKFVPKDSLRAERRVKQMRRTLH